ncbi:MAG: DUF669 domain-containing protein, partial [Desulfovibrio sp.]|nr:DUF669 domain-containing protein [Desulfovibrio sp.]
MNLGSYDMNAVPEYGYDLLPPGVYDVTIARAEVKSWPSGDRYLSLWYRIDGPDRAGAVVFDSLSLWDREPKYQSIAYSRLKSIRTAIGLNPNVPGDTDDLMDRRMKVKIGVRTKEGREFQQINKYMPIGASGAQPAPAQP